MVSCQTPKLYAPACVHSFSVLIVFIPKSLLGFWIHSFNFSINCIYTWTFAWILNPLSMLFLGPNCPGPFVQGLLLLLAWGEAPGFFCHASGEVSPDLELVLCEVQASASATPGMSFFSHGAHAGGEVSICLWSATPGMRRSCELLLSCWWRGWPDLGKLGNHRLCGRPHTQTTGLWWWWCSDDDLTMMTQWWWFNDDDGDYLMRNTWGASFSFIPFQS